MNLILFSKEETEAPLPLDDPRAQHLLKTLRRLPGDTFDAGIVNGARIRGTLREIRIDSLLLEFREVAPPPPLHPVGLLVGLSRPQTARKILRETTSLGVSEIHFCRTEKGEPSYAESKLWTTGEYRRHLIAGAEQAFTSRIPEIEHHGSLAAALDALAVDREIVALDNYETTGRLRDHRPSGGRSLLIVGSERGWSAGERDVLRARRIPLLALGTNVLRTETAALCGLALLLAKRKLL